MRKNQIFILILLVFTFLGVFYFSINHIQPRQSAQIVNAFEEDFISQAKLLPISSSRLVGPVDGFRERIIKKSFGIFITPETSPIENDRFSGYHTGVDAEFTDVIEDVPVRAIADGTILVRAYASGYGGVVVARHIINGTSIVALYGHLDQKSFLPSSIVNVKAGDQIGILGDDHSDETDGVRKHLHFSLHPDRGDEEISPELSQRIDFRGYVKTQEELTNWLNPLDFY